MMCTIEYITSAFIHACRRNGQELIAFEKNSEIFDAILTPLCDSLPPPIVHGKNDDKPIRKVPKKFHLNM